MKLRLYQVVHASEDSRPVSRPLQESVSSFSSRILEFGVRAGCSKTFRRASTGSQHERKTSNHLKLCTICPDSRRVIGAFFGTCWTTDEAGARRCHREFS